MERIWQKYYGNIPTEVQSQGTVVDMMQTAVQRWGDKPAFHCLHADLTYNQVDARARDVAAWMQNKLGMKKGDRVAVMMPNLLAHPVVSYAIIRSGGIQVNVNPLYTPRELAHQLNDSGARTIIIFNQVTPTLAAVLAETGVKHIITTGLFDLGVELGPNPPVHEAVANRSVPLPQVLLEGADMDFVAPEVAPDDLLFLQYTGGTTGLSKGAMLSHANLIANIDMFEAWTKDVARPGEEIVMTALPLYHIFALMVNFLSYFKFGAHNVLIPNPRDMPGFVTEWKKWRVTCFTGVNTLYVGLMMTPGFEECDFLALTVAFGGGAPVQSAVSERWKALTGIHITEGYGLSETSPILTANLLTSTEFTASIGLPMPSTDISIRDDDGNEVPLGQSGELCAKGPQVMRGYWQREDANAEVFTSDGYFRTGDVAVVDEEGYFRIVDRKKDMILVSGFNVYPNEIEDVLAAMPQLVESACVGMPDDKTGEAVRVYCVKKDEGITEQAVMDFCRDRLTAYKVPRQVVFLSELPKSTVGKILRRELRGK